MGKRRHTPEQVINKVREAEVELTVFRQEAGSETTVCTTEQLWAPTSGSKACNGGPGDFRLGVATSGDNDWFVSITPQ